MGDIFRYLEGIFIMLGVSLVLALPLAVWKLIELVMWAYNHVHISAGVS